MDVFSVRFAICSDTRRNDCPEYGDLANFSRDMRTRATSLIVNMRPASRSVSATGTMMSSSTAS